MIDTPTTNPTLTFDQLQAIDTTKKILSNLESEITNAQKILKGTKMECDRAVKEKVYQEELRANATTQAEAKTKELKNLNDNIIERTEMLNELLSQFKEHTDLMASEKADHDTRESKIVSRETELANQENALNGSINIYLKEVKDFNEKVAQLKEVLSIF